jgi:hypothetical protein
MIFVIALSITWPSAELIPHVDVLNIGIVKSNNERFLVKLRTVTAIRI